MPSKSEINLNKVSIQNYSQSDSDLEKLPQIPKFNWKKHGIDFIHFFDAMPIISSISNAVIIPLQLYSFMKNKIQNPEKPLHTFSLLEDRSIGRSVVGLIPILNLTLPIYDLMNSGNKKPDDHDISIFFTDEKQEIVLNDLSKATEAVKENGMSLEHASDEIKKDWNVVRETIDGKGSKGFQFADPEIKRTAQYVNYLLTIESFNKEFNLVDLLGEESTNFYKEKIRKNQKSVPWQYRMIAKHLFDKGKIELNDKQQELIKGY